MPRRDPIRRAVPLLVLLGASASAAFADAGHALNYSIRHSLSCDDNLFRLPDGLAPAGLGLSSRSDVQSVTDVAVSFDWRYGLQRVRANLSATAQRHRRNSGLDNDGHGADVAWLGRSGKRFDGEFGWSRTAAQSSFSDLRTPIRNITTTTTAVAAAHYWFHADWSAGLSGAFNDYSNSSSLQTVNDTESTVGVLSLRYQPTGDRNVSFRRAETSGRYPNPQTTFAGSVSNDYRQSETGVEVRYRVSGASELNGGLGRVERRHRDVAARDFRGLTGRAVWNWQASGRTGVLVAARREIGAQSGTLASYALTDSLSVGIDWSAGAKTLLSVSMLESRREFGGDPAAALAGIGATVDRTRQFSFGASYSPLTRLSLSLKLRDERRDSTQTDRDYRARQLTAGIAYQF